MAPTETSNKVAVIRRAVHGVDTRGSLIDIGLPSGRIRAISNCLARPYSGNQRLADTVDIRVRQPRIARQADPARGDVL